MILDIYQICTPHCLRYLLVLLRSLSVAYMYMSLVCFRYLTMMLLFEIISPFIIECWRFHLYYFTKFNVLMFITRPLRHILIHYHSTEWHKSVWKAWTCQIISYKFRNFFFYSYLFSLFCTQPIFCVQCPRLLLYWFHWKFFHVVYYQSKLW